MCIYHLQTIKHKYKVGLKFHILVQGITSFSNLYFYIVDLARCKWFVIMQGELVLQCSNSVCSNPAKERTKIQNKFAFGLKSYFI